VGTGGDCSRQLLGWGDQQCIGPPTFFSVVLKKQEISQQVLLLMSSEAPRMQDFEKYNKMDVHHC